jgi:glucuronokinase
LKDIKSLNKDVKKHGYYGGIRLLKAASKKFYDYCQENSMNIDASKKFRLSYSTNIPRQMGLGGSSAIIISTLKVLMEYYKVEIAKPLLANLALSVETEELDISAGLQDRVVQSYSAPIYMNFSKSAFAKNNDKYGIYEEIDKSLLPKLFLIYSNAPSESGKVHSKVGFRFKRGEKKVVKAMEDLAKLTDRAKKLIETKNYSQLAKIFNKNFSIRRSIYGDKVIGKKNLKMIKLPRKIGLSSKFSGSGGAIIGIWQKNSDFAKLKQLCQKNKFILKKIKL